MWFSLLKWVYAVQKVIARWCVLVCALYIRVQPQVLLMRTPLCFQFMCVCTTRDYLCVQHRIYVSYYIMLISLGYVCALYVCVTCVRHAVYPLIRGWLCVFVRELAPHNLWCAFSIQDWISLSREYV